MTSPATDPRGPVTAGPRSIFDGLAEQGAKGALIAAVSTVAFFGVLIWQIGRSEAWPKVRDQFFDADRFVEVFPDVLSGFWLDIRMFLVAEVIILVLSLLIAMARSLRGPAFFPIRALAVVFVDVFRGIPVILLILIIGFGIPALDLRGVTNDPLVLGLTALVLSYSAYTAEVYRAGIESVHESQRMSARSIGLSQMQTLSSVLVPQAVRNVIPALLNGFVSLQKDVALVFVLGVREGVREAQIDAAFSFNYTAYIAATLLFLVVSIPLARFTDWYAERDRRRRQAMAS